MSKRRFSKQDWVRLGLDELSAGGPEAIKLEAICKAAGLTRGSFYHHFTDHDAFVLSLARHWLSTQTTDIIDTIDPDAAPPEQNAALTDTVIDIDYRLELGVRELARRTPKIAEIVQQADQARLETLCGLYQRRYDLEHDRAKQMALMEYATFSGIILLDPDMPKQQQQDLAKLYETLIDRALLAEKSD